MLFNQIICLVQKDLCRFVWVWGPFSQYDALSSPSVDYSSTELDISSDTLFLLSFCPQANTGRSSFWSTLDISQLSSALYKPDEKNLPGEDYRLQNLCTLWFLSFYTDRWDIKRVWQKYVPDLGRCLFSASHLYLSAKFDVVKKVACGLLVMLMFNVTVLLAVVVTHFYFILFIIFVLYFYLLVSVDIDFHLDYLS